MQRSLLINSLGNLQETDLDANLILNGDFEVNQGGAASFNFTANLSVYTVDQWIGVKTGSGAFTLAQSTDVPTVSDVGGYPGARSFRVQITTPQTTFPAADCSQIQTRIEGYRFRSIVGKPFTVSFWVKANKPGIYCMSVRGGDPIRSYVAEYTINQSNVWERKVVSIPAAPTSSGNWNYDIGMALIVEWTLASGSTFRTATPNSWISGSFILTANAVNVLDTVGNTFQLALVKLEPGITATPFKHLDFESSLGLCRRYYTRMSLTSYLYAGVAGDTIYVPISVPNFMRVAPTASLVTAGNRTNLAAGFPASAFYSQKDGYFVVGAASVGWFGTFNDVWEYSSRM